MRKYSNSSYIYLYLLVLKVYLPAGFIHQWILLGKKCLVDSGRFIDRQNITNVIACHRARNMTTIAIAITIATAAAGIIVGMLAFIAATPARSAMPSGE